MRAANSGKMAGAEAFARSVPGLVVVKTWTTTFDERTCTICGPLDGQVVSAEAQFVSSERGGPGEQLRPAAEITTELPPIHARCRCVVDTSTEFANP